MFPDGIEEENILNNLTCDCMIVYNNKLNDVKGIQGMQAVP